MEGEGRLLDLKFRVMDTAGFEDEDPDTLPGRMRAQTEAAVRDGDPTVTLPVEVEAFTISLLWHPRMDGDPAHRWLRQCVRDACAEP